MEIKMSNENKEITAEELVAVLKFTPRTYHISLWGYGGERVMGRVNQESWDYCMENQVDLSEIAWNSDAAEDMGLDADKLPFTSGSWYECDDFAHASGVSLDSGTLQIEDELNMTILEKDLENLDPDEEDCPELETVNDVYLAQFKKGDIIFIGSSNEKGTFFEGDIELNAPFDITKLRLISEEIDGEKIINGVVYDGEDIDNYGGNSDGKSSDFSMFRMKDDDGNFERYAPGEKDWGHPEYGTSPSGWEKSVDFDFKKTKPTIPGYYSVNYGYGGTYSSLYWDGKEFGEWEFGKFNPVDQKGVEKWSGYNWDTSNWANQPKEPPDIICDNKKCSWTGMSDDRRTDDEYTDHCPECDGTEFSWIDYDPNTAKGRKNREKYIK
jgi:hypothetical protein